MPYKTVMRKREFWRPLIMTEETHRGFRTMGTLQLKALRNTTTDTKTTRGKQHQRNVCSPQDVTAPGNRNTYRGRTAPQLERFPPAANAREPVEAAAGAVPDACPHSTPPASPPWARTAGPSAPLPSLAGEPGGRQVHPLPGG